MHFAWKGHREMTYTVSGGTLNPTHSVTHSLLIWCAVFWEFC